MIIKLVLLAGLIGTFGYALSQHRRSRWLATALMVISVAGRYFCAFTEPYERNC